MSYLLSSKKVGDRVRFREGGKIVEYIIVHKGRPSSLYDSSCDGVWLLRQKPLPDKRVFDGSALGNSWNDYENSDIVAWLKSTFYNTIESKVRNVIKTVKIPYKKGNGPTSPQTVSSGSAGLLCNVFFLSAFELGFTAEDNKFMYEDGAVLDYFKGADKERRIAKLNGNTTTWWLRTESTVWDFSQFCVEYNGGISDYNTYGEKAVRPAFIVPDTLQLDELDNPPEITCDKSGNLGTLSSGFSCTYSIQDEDDSDILEVTEKLDGKVIRSFEAERNKNYKIEFLGKEWLKIANGEHKLEITVDDAMETDSRVITFTRSQKSAFVSLAEPLEADDIIRACNIQITGNLSGDAVLKVEVTNNANDDEPVWEDCTVRVKSGFSYLFKNSAAENGSAFNFRVSVSRGASGEGGYISRISGGFE